MFSSANALQAIRLVVLQEMHLSEESILCEGLGKQRSLSARP
jgi:hypothetical protein